MPRKPRLFLPEYPVHVVQRGHSRKPVFFRIADRRRYLSYLAEASVRYRCRVHAYVLMTNHVHILASSESADGISRMMQFIGGRYVRYIHVREGSSGSLWEGRYKASLIQHDRYLLACMRYIELNPVRAGISRTPGAYRWSSYHYNAKGSDDTHLSPHEIYLSLGSSSARRCASYRRMFEGSSDSGVINDLRSAWQSGTPLGDEGFQQFLEQKLGHKLGQARRGRPSRA